MRDDILISNIYRSNPGILFEDYQKLFEYYVGQERKNYLLNFLKKDTYIITMNTSEYNILNVLRYIDQSYNIDVEHKRIYSVRDRYNSFVKMFGEKIDKKEYILQAKLYTISILKTDEETALFIDDLFDETDVLKSTQNWPRMQNLKYIKVEAGIQNKMIVDLSKYDKIFLDFDNTITRNTTTKVTITRQFENNKVETTYDYGDFLKYSNKYWII